MAHTDAFALKNSGLNPFLFSEVGIEANGSGLTILSILARLGEDPWAEAAKWAKLPKEAMVDRLAQCMAKMPLSPQALADARATAARLFLLLPTQAAASPGAAPKAAIGIASLPKWLPITVLYAALAIGLLVSLVVQIPHAAHTAPATTADTIVPGNAP